MDSTRRQWMMQVAAGQSGVHEEIRKLAEQAPLGMQFRGRTAQECRRWQQQFAAKLGELLGPYRPPQRWETLRERSFDFGDHRREELVLRTPGQRDLPVHLLTPRGS